ncbi:MAG: haloacid dehalogenase-like hydrolase [Ruminococcus sp.]|nr:haloacid dehalogenase-like hydrolase [Ruminococcus sp.]
MNVFDFDNTIYRGESAVDLAVFMIKSNKKVILWMPKIFWSLLKYKLCLVSREKMQDSVNDFMSKILRDKNEVRSLTRDFWKKNIRKLDRSIIKRIGRDDVIITAGPDFMLDAVKKHLGTENVICSQTDLDRKCVIYLNFGENKLKKFKEKYGDTAIECFYTDSFNDKALMSISKKVFIVKKGKIRRINPENA